MRTQTQAVFERYEKKYLLDPGQYTVLREALRGRMEEDSTYGRYTIRNIYFDTPDYRIIRASLDKPVYKEKLRLRSYGAPGPGVPVFLELKKKYKGVVYKRRVSLPPDAAAAYLSCGSKPEGENQILNEIDWFIRLYHPEPKIFIAYDRIALSGADDPDLRMTFDADLRWRESPLILSGSDKGRPILEDPRILMEIKIPGVMPLWLAHILGKMDIYPVSFSKYGTCYQRYLARGFRPLGGVVCA